MNVNTRNGLWCSTILSSALISACGGDDVTERLGKFDPELPPELYCAGLCGDGECIAFSGEDCGNCLQDCGGAAACLANGTTTFSPGAASLALGSSLKSSCIPNGAVAERERGVVDGASPLPFKAGAARFLSAPPGCGGIGDDEPSAGEGVSLRDGTLGVSLTCLRVGPNAKGAPLGVGLRYETGRWRSVDPVAHPGAHLRPGSVDVGDFWFVSYTRRLHGDFPEHTVEPWASAQLPANFTLYLEDYTSYTFERDGDTANYVQPGATTASAVAYARIADESDANVSCSGDFGPQLIAPNDILIIYPDGSIDALSGRDLTFKGHIDNERNQIVVTYGMRETQSGEATCPAGAPGTQLGIKRIASIPRGETEATMWIDLEHEYFQGTRPGYPGQFVESWRLARVRDSLGRVIQLNYGTQGEDLDRLWLVTMFPGRPEQQQFRIGYDATGVADEIAFPPPLLDALDAPDPNNGNLVTIAHAHPDLALGGLSRVLSQARRINGVAGQATSFAWLDEGGADLKVSHPNGDTQRFAHEQSQAATAAGMDPTGARDNLLSAIYNINATVKPATVTFDPTSKLVTQRCDAEGTPGGTPANPGDRCSGYVYDANLNLQRVVGRNEEGELVAVELVHEQFVPSNFYKVTKVTTPAGVETTVTHTQLPWLTGRMQTVQVAQQIQADQETTYAWCDGEPGCPAGALKSVTSPMQAVTAYTYDEEDGTPTATVLPNGGQSLTEYDLRGCLLATTSVGGTRTTFKYSDGNGLQGDCAPTEVIDNPQGVADKLVTSYQYDPARNLVLRTRDVGGGRSNSDTETAYRHRTVTPGGAAGLVLTLDGGAGGSGYTVHKQTSYDPHGAVVKLTDVAMSGRTMTRAYAYKADGTLTVTAQRSGISAVATETFDASGQPLSAVDTRGVTSTRTYNAHSGRLEVTVAGAAPVPSHAAANLVTEYFYDDDGRTIRVEQPDGVVVTHDFDALGRLDARNLEVNAEVHRTEYDYDKHNRQVDVRQLRNGAVEREELTHYEGVGKLGPRPVEEALLAFGDGGTDATTRYDYKAEAWTACATATPGSCWKPTKITTPERVVSGAGPTQAYAYDGRERLVGVTEFGAGPGGTDASWTYALDGLDCMRSVNGPGRVQSFDCDRRGRTTAEYEGAASRAFSYYPDDTLAAVVDFDGSGTNYGLDASGWRVGGISYTPAAGVLAPGDALFTYTVNDLLATVSSPSGTSVYDYDAANRMASKTRTTNLGATRTITYGRTTGSGLVSSIDYWGEGSVSMTHKNGMLDTLTAFGGAPLTYAWRGDGLIAGVSSPGLSVDYDYSDVNSLPRISNISYTGAGNKALFTQVTYNRDAAGNVLNRGELWEGQFGPPLDESFTYDEQSRLKDVTLQAFTWQSETIPGPGWSLPAFSAQNVYDARGNATSHLGKSYTFDAEDRLAGANFSHDKRRNLTCIDTAEAGSCHCSNAIKDADEEGVDCGGAVCEPCGCVEGVLPARPAITDPCALDGNFIDVNAIAAKVEALYDPSKLQFTQQVDPYGQGQCAPLNFVKLPVPCSAVDGFKYRVTLLGGAVTKNWIGFFPGLAAWNWTMMYQTLGDPMSLANEVMYATSAYQGDPAGACGDAMGYIGELPVGPVDPELSDYVLAYPAFSGPADPNLPAGMQTCFDQIMVQATSQSDPGCSSGTSAGALFIAFDPGQCY